MQSGTRRSTSLVCAGKLRSLSASAHLVVLELLTCIEKPELPLPDPSFLLHWAPWLVETLRVFGLHT